MREGSIFVINGIIRNILWVNNTIKDSILTKNSLFQMTKSFSRQFHIKNMNLTNLSIKGSYLFRFNRIRHFTIENVILKTCNYKETSYIFHFNGGIKDLYIKKLALKNLSLSSKSRIMTNNRKRHILKLHILELQLYNSRFAEAQVLWFEKVSEAYISDLRTYKNVW